MRLSFIFSLLLAMTLNAATFGQALKVGSTAPGLDVERWLTGDEVKIENGTTYVVHFWSRDNSPSIRTIAMLSEIQKAYADDGLQIVGITTGDDASELQNWTRANDRRFTYPLGHDRRQATNAAWLRSAQRDVPTTFIVDEDGTIQWIGEALLDEEFFDILALVILGRYDQKLYEQYAGVIRGMRNARKVRNFRLAHAHLDDIIAADKRVFAMFTIDKFEMMLADQRKEDEAYAYAMKLMKDYSDDPSLLGALAEHIAASDELVEEQRRFDVALQIAQAASRVTNPNDPDRYSGEAVVHFRAGNLDEAYKLQRKAYQVASPSRKPSIKRVLDTYREARNRARAARKN